MRDWTVKLLTGSSMPLRGHYTLQNVYKMPRVGNYRISMCCSCQCPSTCVGKLLVYMHPCSHSFVNTHLRGSAVTFSTRERLHGKMPVLWATMNVLPHRVTFWLFTASEKREEKENILGRRKNAHSAVRICAKINSGIFWPDMTSRHASVPQVQYNNNNNNN